MKDTLEQLKQLNSILDKLENPVVVESKKLKKSLIGEFHYARQRRKKLR